MKLTLRKIQRTNWREAIDIRLDPGQESFVSSPVKSLVGAYVRQHGDQYDYAPMGIYAGETIVGYVSTLCDSSSKEDYWIDDIMIDVRYQGKGLGRAAVAETIGHILQTYPQCEAIKLSCHRNNRVAATLYKSMGFELTGELNAMTGEPNYQLSEAAMRRYRCVLSA